ncbi:MAG: OadG family protein [Kiritimatiellales bacterium]|nr:OadG family protein [Kiritimatiellales bacterium]
MEEGLVLMVVGMGTVFAFLVLLVVAMQLSAKFFTKFAYLFPEAAPKNSKPAAVADFSEIAVAIAAVKAHTN